MSDPRDDRDIPQVRPVDDYDDYEPQDIGDDAVGQKNKNHRADKLTEICRIHGRASAKWNWMCRCRRRNLAARPGGRG